MTCHCIIVVVAFTFLVFGNVFAAPNKSPIVPTTGQICKDGKGPLLEGEDSPFPCADECPDGFICEHPIEDEPLGICCPNLDILYELYGKNSAEEIGSDSVAPQTASTIPTTLNTKEVGEVHKFANSWQETSEVPEIVSSSFTETLPLERDTNDEQKARFTIL
uniref:Uncharacterized protein n=1 Tax=Panagrolaimus superbus TaxID=310955 RepID=A0A914Z9R1_9BILA